MSNRQTDFNPTEWLTTKEAAAELTRCWNGISVASVCPLSSTEPLRLVIG
jgi:hypothetical protein